MQGSINGGAALAARGRRTDFRGHGGPSDGGPVKDARDAKISDFDHHVLCKEQVGRLEVAVDDAALVQVAEARSYIVEELQLRWAGRGEGGGFFSIV